MALNYGYKYAVIELSMGGICLEVQDTTNYILRPDYIPIEDDTLNYALKYYYPIPETVTSFDDFEGKWYLDAEHTQEATELNG